MRLSSWAVIALGASCGATGEPDGGRCSSVAFERWLTFDDVREVYTLGRADLDGDGTPDLFAGESTRARVSLFLAHPGSDAGLERRLVPSVGDPIAVTAFTQQGRLGLLAGGTPDGGLMLLGDVASASPPGAVTLAGVSWPAANGLAQLRPAGASVVVAASRADWLLRGATADGSGGLSQRFVFDAGNFGGPGITADLDGDLLADVAFTTYFTGLAVLTAASAFSVVPQATSDSLGDLSVGDLDADGDLDVVQAAGTSIGVYLNDGAAHFQATDTHAAGTAFSGVDVADFDLDGRLDVVGAQETSVAGVELFAYAASQLTPMTAFGVDAGLQAPAHVVAADLDGDGRPDLAVTDRLASSLVVFRNVSPDCPSSSGTAPQWRVVGCSTTSAGPALLAALALGGPRRRRARVVA